MARYAFIHQEKDHYPITMMCRCLRVARSGVCRPTEPGAVENCATVEGTQRFGGMGVP